MVKKHQWNLGNESAYGRRKKGTFCPDLQVTEKKSLHVGGGARGTFTRPSKKRRPVTFPGSGAGNPNTSSSWREEKGVEGGVLRGSKPSNPVGGGEDKKKASVEKQQDPIY